MCSITIVTYLPVPNFRNCASLLNCSQAYGALVAIVMMMTNLSALIAHITNGNREICLTHQPENLHQWRRYNTQTSTVPDSYQSQSNTYDIFPLRLIEASNNTTVPTDLLTSHVCSATPTSHPHYSGSCTICCRPPLPDLVDPAR
jgi:hypothetical protein